jgi:hypothetical protein
MFTLSVSSVVKECDYVHSCVPIVIAKSGVLHFLQKVSGLRARMRNSKHTREGGDVCMYKGKNEEFIACSSVWMCIWTLNRFLFR